MEQKTSHEYVACNTRTKSGVDKSLRSQCADLSMLIYVMEHDRSLNASAWQIVSLKHSLRQIMQKIDKAPPELLTNGSAIGLSPMKAHEAR